MCADTPRKAQVRDCAADLPVSAARAIATDVRTCLIFMRLLMELPMSDPSAPGEAKAGQPGRRFMDRHVGGPTLIGAGTEFRGDLICKGDLAVSGSVVGDADVQGSVTLADSAYWQGGLRAANAVLAGRIEGHVLVQEKLEIRKTARINGSVAAKIIAIAEGAVIEGDIQVLGNAPVVHFQEKREG